MNYGYTVSETETFEERQQRLCLEVFQAAEIGKGDVLIDVGFGSGEQDFLLSNAYEFRRLIGFNISERQVRYANERALLENGTQAVVPPGRGRASFRCRGIIGGSSSGDRVRVLLRRPRFYERAAQVLKPGGLWSWPTSRSPIVPRS